jgi:hypothetical protein
LRFESKENFCKINKIDEIKALFKPKTIKVDPKYAILFKERGKRQKYISLIERI